MAHTQEVKAAAMAALLAGQSISQVAEEYHLPRGTVSYWSGLIDRSQPTNPSTKKEIGALILEYLRANLVTLTAQMRVFSDVAWLKKQPASELAVLHGVCADKAIRLLEAFSGDTDDSGEVETAAGAANTGV
ncbi:MAG TPA: hypothetical protein PK406_00675 [Verrucomicrobiota bacterium]|nr:hypothetical protein [Verrucomicrobiota bacterium]